MNHPLPAVLARNLRQLADRLDDEGDHAIRRAPILAARGWPTNLNGTDGGPSSDATSSTERAALNPGPYDDIDNRLHRQLNLCGLTVRLIHSSLDTLQVHKCKDTDCMICADTFPGGTGPCPVELCDHVCNPRKKPDDRLRAGYCPRHYRRWLRQGRPDRGWYEHTTETEDIA